MTKEEKKTAIAAAIKEHQDNLAAVKEAGIPPAFDPIVTKERADAPLGKWNRFVIRLKGFAGASRGRRSTSHRRTGPRPSA
jgi:hypothetical protein